MKATLFATLVGATFPLCAYAEPIPQIAYDYNSIIQVEVHMPTTPGDRDCKYTITNTTSRMVNFNFKSQYHDHGSGNLEWRSYSFTLGPLKSMTWSTMWGTGNFEVRVL